MKNKILYSILLPTIIFCLDGYELASLIDSRLKPADIQSTNSMKLINKKGRIKNLKLISKSKDNNKRQMIWFISPADDKGMAFLKIEHPDKDNLMKMWLPGFKKFRRIASNKQSDSFMGSDLSFEDLTNRKINDYTHNLIEEKEICTYKEKDYNCSVLESIPNEINSGYTKHITWIIQIEEGIYLAIKEHSFDKDRELLKIKNIEFNKIESFYIMNNLFVKNIKKKSSTLLTIDNISLNLGFKDEMFKETNLKRLP